VDCHFHKFPRKVLRRLFALLLISSCLQAHAGEAQDRAALSQQLADLLEIRAQYGVASAKCAQSDTVLEKGLLDLQAKHPGEFGGISPKSAYWPEARQIYREYVDAACALTSGETLEPLFVKNYATSMTAEELRAAVAFYSSPAGRTLQAANWKIFEEVTDLAYHNATEGDQGAAALMYRQSMLILKHKYEREPK
jgi:hypothetical protein